jgi:preprotein translocase subunit SecE
MNAKSEAKGSSLDLLRWVAVALLVVAAVVGNQYFSGELILYRVVGILLVAGLAAFLALQTGRGQAFWGLLREARTEIRKVVWPTRQETMQTTAVVVVVVVVMALLLWGLDSFLGWLVSFIVS